LVGAGGLTEGVVGNTGIGLVCVLVGVLVGAGGLTEGGGGVSGDVRAQITKAIIKTVNKTVKKTTIFFILSPPFVPIFSLKELIGTT